MKPSALPGGAGLIAQMERAFAGVMEPYQVRRSSLVTLATLLGMDEDDADGPPIPGGSPNGPVGPLGGPPPAKATVGGRKVGWF